MASELFSLCWDDFHKNMSSGMNSLLETGDLVDVTLAIEGKYLRAHKMVLSVCSPYFRELFQMNPCKHPIVFMKDVSYVAMRDLLTFMYQGEVQVNQEQLTTFVKTAEALQIKGLTSDGNNEAVNIMDDQSEDKITTRVAPPVYVMQENDVIMQSTQKTKKVLSSASTSSYPPVKRQKPSSPTRDKPLTIMLKADAAPSSLTTEQKPPTSEQLLHIKMEPFEVDQSDAMQVETYDENPDDAFGEDGMDEGAVDDLDYNTMLKEEDEPQATTSGDSLGKGQGKDKQRKKRTAVTLKEKNSIIEMVEKGIKKTDISKKYGITTSTIVKIAKKRDVLIQKMNELSGTMKNRSRLDEGENPVLEKILVEWIKQKRSLGIAIQGPMIREKAMEIYKELQKKTIDENKVINSEKKRHTFKASEGWLHKFKRRYGIRQIAIKGEQAAADKSSAEEFTEFLSTMIQNEEYSLDNIYNGDETELSTSNRCRKEP